MRHLGVRWKVALAFAATAAVVLTALGAFVYARVSEELTDSIDRGLVARADEVGAVAQRSPEVLVPRPGVDTDETVAQLLAADASVVATTTPNRVALLTAGQVGRAQRGPLVFERPGDARHDEALRLRAIPAANGQVVVAGSSIDERGEALRALLVTEVIGFFLALVLISGGGYAVSGLVLGPERAALARERRFVADASHELRTPLTILRSEVDVALLEPPTVENLQAALRSTREEAVRLSSLTEDLLALAQLEDGRLPIHREAIDAAALLDRLAGRAWPRPVHASAPPGLHIHADPLRLEQALTNLLDNAMRHGEGAVELTAAADGVGGDGVLLGVRDHGPGVPAGFADRAFERFTRADAARTGGGSGLGLAIVRAVVEAHGGTVSLVDAAPGLRADVRLPHAPLIEPVAP